MEDFVVVYGKTEKVCLLIIIKIPKSFFLNVLLLIEGNLFYKIILFSTSYKFMLILKNINRLSLNIIIHFVFIIFYECF